MTARPNLITLPCLLALLSAAARPAVADEARDTPSLRRFALVASSNDGGPGRVALRFANSDAVSLARVLASLGGVQARDVFLVRDATRASLQEAFVQVRRQIAAERRPQVRRELFMYYSGHSDEDGLLLGGGRVGYQELRRWIDESAAEVRIAVLDSCASGALIRLKGGVWRQAFLSDASTQARGHAFLTASSADEAAQESDRIGAAFFTHYLLSGMRGAADANHDRRVTLNEAYQFAYNETLHRTETSRAGAQHPAYDFQLAGTGDLVITDLHASNARLVLGRALFGRITVRDAGDHLLVELRKEPNVPVELGLDPGAYRVVMDNDGRIFEAKVTLPGGGRVELGKAQFSEVVPMVSTRRGDDVAPIAQPPLGPDLPAPRQYKDVAFDLVLAPGVRLSGASDLPVRHHFVLGVVGHSDSLHGLQLSLAGNIAQYEMVGAQLGGFYQLSYGPARGAQLGWGLNMALGGLHGVQFALANVSNGELRGVQGGLLNINRGSVHGVSGGLVNVDAGSLRGVQGGLVNIVKGDLHGVQAGLVNLHGFAKDSNGLQAGLVNLNGNDDFHTGAMVGLVNVGPRVHGAQVGLVNVASEVRGAQIGLVNFARKNHGASIALLPIVLDDGYNHAALWYSDNSFANIGGKLGTRHVYVVLGAGVTRDRDANGDRQFSFSYGIGGHITPLSTAPFFFDIDAVEVSLHSLSRWNGDDRQVNSLRLQAGYQFAPHLAVVAGPTLNLQVAKNDADRVPRNVSFAEQVWRTDGHVVRMYPGLVAGLQF